MAVRASAKLRLGEVAELLGVSVDTVRRWADGGALPPPRTRGGQRVVDATAVARFAAGTATPPARGGGSSARNRFAGIVTRVVRDRVAAQVELQAGPHRLVALISREAADELGLAPGVLAVAVVKATNVIVEKAKPA